MNRNRGTIALAWLLVAACIMASMAVLLGTGDICIVGREQKEMLERYAKLEAVRSTLLEGFYREVEDDALMTGAIDGMMEALGDPYSFYYTPEDMAQHNETLEGVYHGVGMLLQAGEDGTLEVLRVYEASPAEKAGMQAGDEIIFVDGEAVSGADGEAFARAVERIKGEDGTQLSITVLRGGEEKEFTLTRGSVETSNVEFSMLEGNIGYISIFQFAGNAAEGFRSALKSLEERGMNGLVIDLRDNPGGLLDQVCDIAGALLEEDALVVYTEDRNGEHKEYRASGHMSDVPLAVLVNSMSASASEILAAAVQDHGRGAVIGEKSYGKGIVQAVVSFQEDGSGMQYTISAYFTPSGRSIHGEGVEPNIHAEAGEGYISNSGIPDAGKDTQLRAAMDFLLE